MPTPKQTKLIKLIVENLGAKGKTKTLGALLLEAGYSKEQSECPAQIIGSNTVQEGISDFLGMLDDKRRMAITQITEKKLKKAPARELAYVVDILTKNSQLLSGKETERVSNKLDLTDEQLKRAGEYYANRLSKGSGE